MLAAGIDLHINVSCRFFFKKMTNEIKRKTVFLKKTKEVKIEKLMKMANWFGTDVVVYTVYKLHS